MKHWRQNPATYMYNHCNICNIMIYFYNIRINACNISLKHLKHLKCELATFIISQCSPLRRLHRGVVAVCSSRRGQRLPRQGLAHLLALAARVDVVRPGGWRSRSGGVAAGVARRAPEAGARAAASAVAWVRGGGAAVGRAAEEEQEQHGVGDRSNGTGQAAGEARAARSRRQEQRKGTDARFIGLVRRPKRETSGWDGWTRPIIIDIG
jgi:hypothetical protein